MRPIKGPYICNNKSDSKMNLENQHLKQLFGTFYEHIIFMLYLYSHKNWIELECKIKINVYQVIKN